MSVDSQVTERELDEDEQVELQEAAAAVIERLEPEEEGVVGLTRALEARILARRLATRVDEEEVFRCGALFAGLLQGALGWDLVELDWSGSLTAVAAVELDRSLVVLPFHAVDQLFARTDLPPALASTLERLEAGERPPGLTRNGYAVLLP